MHCGELGPCRGVRGQGDLDRSALKKSRASKGADLEPSPEAVLPTEALSRPFGGLVPHLITLGCLLKPWLSDNWPQTSYYNSPRMS